MSFGSLLSRGSVKATLRILPTSESDATTRFVGGKTKLEWACMDASFIRFSYLDHDLPDEWLIYSAYLEYVLDDGSRLSVSQDDCFCCACNHFVAGECLQTVE